MEKGNEMGKFFRRQKLGLIKSPQSYPFVFALIFVSKLPA